MQVYISSPDFPNIEFLDLPALDTRSHEMISNHLRKERERAIILAVVAARTDTLDVSHGAIKLITDLKVNSQTILVVTKG